MSWLSTLDFICTYVSLLQVWLGVVFVFFTFMTPTTHVVSACTRLGTSALAATLIHLSAWIACILVCVCNMCTCCTHLCAHLAMQPILTPCCYSPPFSSTYLSPNVPQTKWCLLIFWDVHDLIFKSIYCCWWCCGHVLLLGSACPCPLSCLPNIDSTLAMSCSQIACDLIFWAS
jgi:hypothetical protein